MKYIAYKSGDAVFIGCSNEGDARLAPTHNIVIQCKSRDALYDELRKIISTHEDIQLIEEHDL